MFLFTRKAIGAILFCITAFVSVAYSNPTSDENLNVGNDGWKESANIQFDDAQSYIKGYASATSVNKGSSIAFFVTVNNPNGQAYTVSVYRLGYYGGKGGRLMSTSLPASFTGIHQTPCTMHAGPPTSDGMVQCSWTPTATPLCQCDVRHLTSTI